MSETMSSYVHKGSRDFEIEIDCKGLRQISPVITPLYDFSPSGTLTVHTDEIYQPLGKLIFIWKFIYIELNHIGVNSGADLTICDVGFPVWSLDNWECYSNLSLVPGECLLRGVKWHGVSQKGSICALTILINDLDTAFFKKLIPPLMDYDILRKWDCFRVRHAHLWWWHSELFNRAKCPTANNTRPPHYHGVTFYRP